MTEYVIKKTPKGWGVFNGKTLTNDYHHPTQEAAQQHKDLLVRLFSPGTPAKKRS
jgi:hypothetical protein